MDDATRMPPRSVASNDKGIADEAAATAAGGGTYADIGAFFCTAERYPVIVGNTLVYRDDNHVTIEYAKLLGPTLAGRSTCGDETLSNIFSMLDQPTDKLLGGVVACR